MRRGGKGRRGRGRRTVKNEIEKVSVGVDEILLSPTGLSPQSASKAFYALTR
jgi:hypothetical protein